MKTILDIPRKLNINNINQSIVDYLELLKNIPLKIESKNILDMMTDLKRKKVGLDHTRM